MIRCAQVSCMDGIRAKDQNRESLGGSEATPSLQISSIPLLNKRGRWGLLRWRGKGTSLTARGPVPSPGPGLLCAWRHWMLPRSWLNS